MKTGANLLSVWCVLNIVPCIGALIYLSLGKNAPAFQMLFEEAEVALLDPRAIATTNGLAIILNTLVISFSVLAFFVIRWSLMKYETWAYYTLAAVIGGLQVSGYVADVQFQNQNFMILNISSLVLVVGFSLCGVSLLKGPKTNERK